MHELFVRKRAVDKVKDFGVAAGVATAAFLFAAIALLVMVVSHRAAGVLVPLAILFATVFVVAKLIECAWNPFWRREKPGSASEER
ncbi:MAG TPA: hypothetical protein ENF73_04730 [Proteobacteria bacterium]|nr:hypothetical protein [Pseudomonadota bacterium]